MNAPTNALNNDLRKIIIFLVKELQPRSTDKSWTLVSNNVNVTLSECLKEPYKHLGNTLDFRSKYVEH